MVFRSRIAVPVSFRPDHQAGRVLAHVEAELTRQREVVERDGSRLVIDGTWNPGWNARFSGRGLLEFQRQPAPGHFNIRVSVVREALCTATVFPAAVVVAWITSAPLTTRDMLIVAAWTLGACALWGGWGLYKLMLLRRLVQRGIAGVASSSSRGDHT